jgi:YfiH family protein
MLQVKRESNVTFLRSEVLDGIPGIVHAFSTRRADRADFSLASSLTLNPLLQTNRVRFLAASGAAGWPLALLNQVHSATIQDVEDTLAANISPEADAAVTSVRGIVLGIQTADCVPILIAHREARCVAATHAGWRGTVAGIAARTVAQLMDRFQIRPKDLVAVIGPHIGACCYEVGEEVSALFSGKALRNVAERRRVQGTEGASSKPHLDLAAANRDQLISSGIPKNQVDASTLCTRCREDLFYSYRREGARAGRMLSIIGIAP